MSLENIPDGEARATERIVEHIRAEVASTFDRTGFAPRDAHPKAHGLVRATLTVGDDVPDDLRHGVFATPGAEYATWVRFSNAAGKVAADDAKDVRGMAIKVMGVEGPSALGGTRTTQDFVMIDAPRFFIPDAVQYAKFFANQKWYLLHPARWRLLIIAVTMRSRPYSPLAPTYFSATPYMLGHEAIKFRARPLAAPLAAPRRKPSPNRLYESLHYHLSQGPFQFAFEVQRRTNPNTMPIEDPTHEWSEADSSFVRVATLTIPRQNFSGGAQTALGEQLSFSPWNSLTAHRPIGGINRVRRAVYEAISEQRHRLNDAPMAEPTPSSVDDVRSDEPPMHPSVHDNVRQHEFAAVCDIAPGKLGSLRALLADINSELPRGGRAFDPNARVPLHDIDTLHFARFVIMEDTKLILSCNFDGDLDQFLGDLDAACGDGLADVFEHCEGFPGRDGVEQYLRDHRVPASAFFVGAVGRSVHRVRAEQALREHIENYLDDHAPERGWDSIGPQQIRARIRHHVFGEVSKEWLYVPEPKIESIRGKVLAVAGVVAAALTGGLWWWIGTRGMFALAVFIVSMIGVWNLFLRRLLLEDTMDDEHREPLAENTGVFEGPAPVQNWLNVIVPIKPTKFRNFLLTKILWVIYLFARKDQVHGKLDGIRTIMFARWLITENPRRLVFFSNYGGTWEAYLDEFINEAGGWLTSVWSHTVNFPRTRPLFSEGAKHASAFKHWARHYQTNAEVWYTAYPDPSVRNINQNSEIRRGLYGSMTDQEVLEWLRLLNRAN